MGEASLGRGDRRGSVGLRMRDSAPPFSADNVGSLLRTATLKEARKKRARGDISARRLVEVEDCEIETVIRKQEDVGLKSITDGEFRRISWNYDFLEGLEGVESYVGERKIKFNAQGPQPRAVLLRVVGKLGGYKPHPMIEHFRFLKTHTRETPKVTIPSPSRCISATAAMRCRNPSIRRWRISIATSAGPTPRRCGPSPMPAAAIFSSTRSISPICAIRHCASTSSPAGKIRRRCRPSMPV